MKRQSVDAEASASHRRKRSKARDNAAASQPRAIDNTVVQADKMKRQSVDAEASALHRRKRRKHSASDSAEASQHGAIDNTVVQADKSGDTEAAIDKETNVMLKKQNKMEWVYEDLAMVYRNVNYIPLLYNIFEEILMPLVRYSRRSPNIDDLHVRIRAKKCCISIKRYGLVLPIQEDGLNPLNALLSNSCCSTISQDPSIFSKCMITTFDGSHKRKKVFYGEKKYARFTQQHHSDLTACTSVAICLNMDRLGLDKDILALMRKRVLEVAGLNGHKLKVKLDGHVLPNKFSDYVDLYVQSSKKTSKRIYQKLCNNWEVCVSLSTSGQFQQFTFVNDIATYEPISNSGVHVDRITSSIEKHLIYTLAKKRTTDKIQTSGVKRHLWVFIKGTYTVTDVEQLEPAFHDDKFIKFLTQVADADSFIFKEVFRCALKEALAVEVQKEGDESIETIPKFDDATSAGGVDSHKCTLIITEGDSAKSLANVGLGVHGRKLYGVFALKGKLLNVRTASFHTISRNNEINNLRKIIGLDYRKDYCDKKELRYGQVLIMTDQDVDGFHIKGLVINFFHYFWPSLIKIHPFLSELITPLIKVTDDTGKSQPFYNMPQFRSWEKSKTTTDLSAFSIKYYKGLGTSTLEEGMEYFRHIHLYQKDFEWVDEEDNKAIEIAFGKNQVKERKKWILNFQPETFLPESKKTRILDFINQELILYSISDVQRSIPSGVDGLKPSQRKIIYSAFQKVLIKEIRVSRFVGYVSECSAYHHGEDSLSNTIVGMAQNFCGSNNINLLRPKGQFGTRLEGGNDAAKPRYINTELSRITRTIFNENDDSLLDYLHEDGQSVEPTWYIPIVPMVLVNGCEGIGTGWSTKIPSYNPRDVVRNLKHLMRGEDMEEMKPWFRQFHGEIKQTTKKGVTTYTTCGVIDVVDSTTLKIRELPMNISMENYEEKLKDFIKKKIIKSYEKKQGINDIEIVLHLDENSKDLRQVKNVTLLKKFKLTNSTSTSNMHLLDSDGKLKKYDSPQQILNEFFGLRRAFYEKRREKLLKRAKDNLSIAQNKVKFIKAAETREIRIYDMDEEKLRLELRVKGFETHENQNGAEAQGFLSGYEYLLSMPYGNFTAQMVERLEAECEQEKKNITKIEKCSAEKLWLRDLRAFEKQLDILDREEQDQAEDVGHMAIDDGRTQLQRDRLLDDLKSLSPEVWITDGVIDRVFTIFESIYGNDMILLIPQSISSLLSQNQDPIATWAVLSRSLVLIPLHSEPIREHEDEEKGHYSLLVLDNTKDKFMFRHYDTSGSTNKEVAQDMVQKIKREIPDIAEEEILDVPVPQQQDLYNCGIYVLAITEAICKWFKENKESANQLTYDSSVTDMVEDHDAVNNMRNTYYRKILDHENFPNPGYL